MQINKSELNLISRKFRSYASQAINATNDNAHRKLNILIEFIDNTPIIYEYINSLEDKKYDVEREILRIGSDDMEGVNLGLTTEDEIVRTYQLLLYARDNYKGDSLWRLGFHFSNSSNLDGLSRAFGENVTYVLAKNIEDYLLDINSKMGYDMEVIKMITVNGGSVQVNVANDKAKIDATQNNYNNQNQDLQNVIKQIREDLVAELDVDDRNSISMNLDTIESQLSNSNPDKNILQVLLTNLNTMTKNIPKAVATAEGIKKLYDIASSMLNF